MEWNTKMLRSKDARSKATEQKRIINQMLQSKEASIEIVESMDTKTLRSKATEQKCIINQTLQSLDDKKTYVMAPCI